MTRHNTFTNLKMRDILFLYVQEKYSCLAGARRYREMYPNRVRSIRNTFSSIFSRLGETGQCNSLGDAGRPKIVTVYRVDDILERIGKNTILSTRRLSEISRVRQSSILQELIKEHIRPYHFTRLQNLLLTDYPLRFNFA